MFNRDLNPTLIVSLLIGAFAVAGVVGVAMTGGQLANGSGDSVATNATAPAASVAIATEGSARSDGLSDKDAAAARAAVAAADEVGFAQWVDSPSSTMDDGDDEPVDEQAAPPPQDSRRSRETMSDEDRHQ